MLNIRLQGSRDPRRLAKLIESTHGGAAADAQLTAEAKLVLAAQAQAEADRPTRNELDTVNFQRLDTENDWTDV